MRRECWLSIKGEAFGPPIQSGAARMSDSQLEAEAMCGRRVWRTSCVLPRQAFQGVYESAVAWYVPPDYVASPCYQTTA